MTNSLFTSTVEQRKRALMIAESLSWQFDNHNLSDKILATIEFEGVCGLLDMYWEAVDCIEQGAILKDLEEEMDMIIELTFEV